eukprot:TRINITY_DN229_c1_g1_i2.p1 TRINITY_DN229_c1_g1~~TRINITY_DN229_c1_g1_i2.p1  ORF type:complete len:1015 (-),score=175.22 TRINITY_DN229_c1_g1_i2:340-3384(-)
MSGKARKFSKWPEPARVREAFLRELESLNKQGPTAAPVAPPKQRPPPIGGAGEQPFSLTVARLSETQANPPRGSASLPTPDSPQLAPLQGRDRRKAAAPAPPLVVEPPREPEAVEFVPAQIETDLAVILFLGKQVNLAMYLSHLHHHVIYIDTPTGFSAGACEKIDAIVAEENMWLALETTPSVRKLRATMPGVAIMTFSLQDRPVPMQCIDSLTRYSALQELVKSHATNFFLMQVRRPLVRAQQQVKMLEEQLAAASTALEESEAALMQATEEFAKARSERLAMEQSLSFVTSENAKLRAQVVQARIAAERAAPPTAKLVMVSPYQDLDTLRTAMETCGTPREAASSTLTWLLTDPAYRAVHDLIELTIKQLGVEAPDQQELEEILRASGMDTATQHYILYSFSNKAGRVGRIRRTSGSQAVPPNEKPLQLMSVTDLSVVDSWNFNAIGFGTERLITLYVHMFEKLDLFKLAGVPRNNLIRFLRGAAKLYKDNPYHSFTHAVDVAQVCYKMVHNTTARQYLTDLDVFCLMVAAVCHDMDHPGTSNAFQVADHTALAMIYNDQSPLENHHASCAFYVAAETDCDIFVGLADATYTTARKMIIKAILMTDMQNHFELQKQLTGVQRAYLESKTPESRQFVVNMLIHMADICNPCRPWEICKAWSDLVLQEFFQQGDAERDKGMQISAQCDRQSTKQEAMSMGFIDFIVAPMVAAATAVVPEFQPLVDTLKSNRAAWETGKQDTPETAPAQPQEPAPQPQEPAPTPEQPVPVLPAVASPAKEPEARAPSPVREPATVADTPLVLPPISPDSSASESLRGSAESSHSEPAKPATPPAPRTLTRVRSRSVPTSPASVRRRDSAPERERELLSSPGMRRSSFPALVAVGDSHDARPNPDKAGTGQKLSFDLSDSSGRPRSSSMSPKADAFADRESTRLRASLGDMPNLDSSLLGGVTDMVIRAGARGPASPMFKSVCDETPEFPRSEFFVRRAGRTMSSPKLPTIAKAPVETANPSKVP